MHFYVYALNVISWWFIKDDSLLAVAFGVSFVFLISYGTFDSDFLWLQELDCYTAKWMYFITFCCYFISRRFRLWFT
eukprot:UN14834